MDLKFCSTKKIMHVLEAGFKGSLKNDFTFWTSMNPVRPRCKNPEYIDIPAFSRLAGRALQLLKL
jgi:hypothetical protein